MPLYAKLKLSILSSQGAGVIEITIVSTKLHLLMMTLPMYIMPTIEGSSLILRLTPYHSTSDQQIVILDKLYIFMCNSPWKYYTCFFYFRE